MLNQYENAKKQVLWVYDLLRKENVPYRFIEEFLHPDRVIEVNIPVQMDNWDIKVFKWYRSQHKNIKWPYKWWIRFHEDVTLDEVKALSLWMSIKTSVVDLPLWWWKWWIIVNPKELSFWELEQLSRWYVKHLYRYLWPDFDVPAPDVNTNPQVMSWMADEYSKLVWSPTPWSFTWKPLEFGWSRWRDVATSLWGIYVLEKYCEEKSINIKWKTVAIQWAWNAGLNFAKFIEEKWWKIVSISDSKWALYDECGINLEKVQNAKKDKKSVIDIKEWKTISNKDILELDVDILVLAALENQITTDNVNKIKSKMIVELANWPIVPDVDETLFNNWTIVFPDILANSWWVTVSYFEQIQGNMNFYWTRKEVFEKLKDIMYKWTEDVMSLSSKLWVDYRKASYVISLERQYNTWKYIN